MSDTVPEGHRITFTEDATIGDGWFADLRDEMGRVLESGGGHTQDAARQHLLERAGRAKSDGAAAVAAPVKTDPRLYTLNDHIAALLAEGYEVTFTAGPEGFFADLDKPFDPGAGMTAGGKTLAQALWAASPLHGDDVPFIVTDEGARASDLDDLYDRVNVLEDRHDKFDQTESALVKVIVMLLKQDPEFRAAREAAAAKAVAENPE